jgi:hypothetical protein
MSELFEAAKPLLTRFAAYLESHPEHRADWIAFAKAATAYFESGHLPAVVAAPAPATFRPEPRPFAAAPTHFAPPAPRFGEGGFEPEREQVPLPTMAKRCRVKAEACRVLAKRFAGAVPEPDDTTGLFKKAAELPDCGLWMLTGSGFNTAPIVWDNLAGAYEAAAIACELMDRVLPRNDIGLEIGLNLAAESQSTLLYAVVDTGRRGPDTDQIELFIRIRETGAQRRIYIPKYLKRDDRADPDNWKDVLARLQREFEQFKNLPASSAIPAAANGRGKAEKTMHSLRYQLKKLKESTATADWDWLFKLIDEAVQNGIPANDAELRDLLLPVLNSVPDDVPANAGVAQVYRELDMHLSAHGADDKAIDETPGPSVSKVTGTLGGREIAIVAGLPRPVHQKALVEAFDLGKLHWVSAVDPGTPIDAEIAKPEIAMVLYSPRWSGLDTATVQAACDRAKKPLVKLTRGLGPNAIAADIVRK